MAVITLANYKTWAGISDTTDDLWLAMTISSVDRAILGGIGVSLDSSADTTRYYDGRDATDGGKRIWVPGGIRAFTTVQVSTDGGATWDTVTNDVRIGPKAQDRPTSEPGAYIEFKDWSAIVGSWAFFPTGTDNVKVTGSTNATFGWSAWPDDLVQAAYVAVQRMSRERDAQGAYPTETNAARYLDRELLRSYRLRYFPGVR